MYLRTSACSDLYHSRPCSPSLMDDTNILCIDMDPPNPAMGHIDVDAVSDDFIRDLVLKYRFKNKDLANLFQVRPASPVTTTFDMSSQH